MYIPNKTANAPNKYGLFSPAASAAHPVKAPTNVPTIRQKLASKVPPLVETG